MRDTPKKARLTMQDRNVDVQEGVKLQNVRRRLFQDDDDVEWKQSLNSGEVDNAANRFMEEIRKSKAGARERWNFDFEKGEPLPGRYEWVKVDQDGNEETFDAADGGGQPEKILEHMNGDTDNATRKEEKSDVYVGNDSDGVTPDH